MAEFWLFKPPVEEGAQWGTDPLMRHYGTIPTGATVWQDAAGDWHQSQYPYNGREDFPGLRQAQRVYLGGSVHELTEADRDALVTAGYADSITGPFPKVA